MMNHLKAFPMTLIALAVMAGCNTLPPNNARLDDARNEYRAAQGNPQTRELAGGELKQAGDALAKADDAWSQKKNPAEVDHLAYLARQQVAIAQETGRQKGAEMAVTNADTARDKIRLAARTDEADAARRSAEVAQRQAEASQRQSAAAQQQADASQRQADSSLQAANEAQARNASLEAQLKDLSAKKTDRGLLITLGDVFFDTNRAELKSGGMRSVEKLGGLLKQFPQRKTSIEGFTDSTGSESTNMDLSDRRANSVRTALVDMGVGSERIATHGYGQAFPVAGNGSAAGRQLNRRVEIILSDDTGSIAPR